MPGDNTPQIQPAINALASQPLDASGFRGAILLKAGVYEIHSTIKISASGIVLRGEGSGANGTLLHQTTGNIDSIDVTGSGSRSAVAGTTHNVTNAYVP